MVSPALCNFDLIAVHNALWQYITHGINYHSFWWNWITFNGERVFWFSLWCIPESNLNLLRTLATSKLFPLSLEHRRRVLAFTTMVFESWSWKDHSFFGPPVVLKSGAGMDNPNWSLVGGQQNRAQQPLWTGDDTKELHWIKGCQQTPGLVAVDDK